MKSIFALCALFIPMMVLAQNDNFGNVQYSVPQGYQLIKHDNVLTYYKEDKNTGAYCNFFIHKPIPGQGTAQKDFDHAWSNLVQAPFKFSATPAMQPEASLKGWNFLTGIAKYNYNGIATLAILINFSKENRMQAICVLSNSDNYKSDIESFIASIDISENIPSDTASPKKQSASPSAKARNNSKIIQYDIWQCQAMNASTLKLELKTVVLSPDGKCLYFMPEKGLNDITPDNSNRSGSWGKVTDKGKMLCLVNEKYGNMELYKLTATSMSRYPNSSSTIYKKVKPVDGLRFEGAYSPELSYHTGKTDITSRIDPNKRPIIFFRKDGSYINEGIEFSNLTFNDSFALGKGTYEIINYSLILTTQSGRKLQIAFTPILDANPTSATNPGFIINHLLYYRLDRSFVPHQ